MSTEEELKQCKKIESHVPERTTFVNPIVMRELLVKVNTYYVPSFVDPKLSPADILNKHKETLEYKQDPYNPRAPEGYIYQRYLLAANTLEQQNPLMDALNESIPLEEKNELQKETWDNLVVQRRPMYMFATVKQTKIDLQTFLPVWSVIKTADETEDHSFHFKVGLSGEDVGLPKDLPYVVYSAPTINIGLEYGYRLFMRLREREKDKFSDYLKSKASKVRSSHLIYLSRLLQTSESNNKMVYYIGRDIMVLVRVDPHTQYLLVVRKLLENALEAETDLENLGEEQPESEELPKYNDYQIMLDADTPFKAVMMVEAYRETMNLSTYPIIPTDRDESIVPSMLGFYNHKVARYYRVENVVVGKTIAVKSAQVYEYINPDKNAITVIVPEWEQEETETVEKPYAYVYTGTVLELAEKFSWGSSNLRQTWLTDRAPLEIDPAEVITEAIRPLGKIMVDNDKGTLIAIRVNAKTKKPEQNEVLQFDIDPILDDSDTIAAMAMHLHGD